MHVVAIERAPHYNIFDRTENQFFSARRNLSIQFEGVMQ